MAKQSYSKIAKKLAAKEKKYSKLFENARNKREEVSAQMMLDRVNSRKEELASENQMRADQIEGNTFGYGGMATKKRSYLNGGMTKKSVYAKGGMAGDPPPITEEEIIKEFNRRKYLLQNDNTTPNGFTDFSSIESNIEASYLDQLREFAYNNPEQFRNGSMNNDWMNQDGMYRPNRDPGLPRDGLAGITSKYYKARPERVLKVGDRSNETQVKATPQVPLSSNNYNPLNNNFRTVSDNMMDGVMSADFSPQKQEDPSILDKEGMNELGLNKKPKASKGSSKANYNNQNVLDYLAANPEFAKYLESKGLTPTLDNIKALQGAIGTEVDNKGGKNTMAALEKYKADYEAALAQGATPEEAEAVAATNQEADKTIDLKTAKSGIDWMQGDFTPSTMDKTMQGIGIGGSFMDNIARARQINRTRPMNAPMYMEAPSIETRMNISPQLNEARNAQAIFNRGIDRSAMSGGQGMAAKASAYAGRINAANKMYGEKSNRETALRNRQRQLAAQTSNQNRQMYGQYRNNLVNFENARLGAMAQNTANFGQDLSSIGGDYMKNIRSPKMQLEAYKPLFGDIMSRNFTGLSK